MSKIGVGGLYFWRKRSLSNQVMTKQVKSSIMIQINYRYSNYLSSSLHMPLVVLQASCWE
jgi:hypothetical protein